MAKVNPEQEEKEPVVTAKLGLRSHTALKMLQKRYKTPDAKLTISDALWQFIAEKDPSLAGDAERAAGLRAQLNEMMGEDEE